MSTDRVTVRLAGRRQLVGWDAAGHGVVMDARPDHNGEGTGVRPIELVLYGLAGCTAMDIVSVLEKKRQDIRDLEVRIEAKQREDEFPKIYTAIRVHYVVTGYGITETAVERAIQLSEDKYCSVKGMIGPQVAIDSTFEIRESRDAGTALLG